MQSGKWSNLDEFSKKDKRQGFIEKYGPPLRAMAPKVPFGLVYAASTRLGPYDEAAKGFELIGLAPSLGRSTETAGVQFRFDFDWPKPFWQVDEQDARAALLTLAAQRGDPREVRLVAVLTAVDGEAESLTLGLRLERMSLYDRDLKHEIYSFPVEVLRHRAFDQDDPLAAMLHPPAGLRPWTLDAVDGRAAIRSLAAWPQDWPFQSASLVLDLFRLAAARAIPGYLDPPEMVAATSHLFTDLRQKPIFSGILEQQQGIFAGVDIAARQRTHEAYYADLAPLLRQAGPAAPFEIVTVQDAYASDYDGAKGGFPIRTDGDSSRPEDRLRLFGQIKAAGLDPAPSFIWPDFLWRADRAAAERTLSKYRRAKVVAYVEVTSINPATRRTVLKLNRIDLRSEDLKTKLYEFPVVNDVAALAGNALPDHLRLPDPIAIDDVLLCANVAEAGGDRVAEIVGDACWPTIAARDVAFYARPDASAGLADDDGARPFFPRASPPAKDAQGIAQLTDWLQRYARGVTGLATLSPNVYSTDPDGAMFIDALPSDGAAGFDVLVAAFLKSEGLQQDQVVHIGDLRSSSSTMPIVFVLPNSRKLYRVLLTPEVRGAFAGRVPSGVTSVKFSRARLFTTYNRSTALAIDVQPVKTELFVDQTRIAARDYGDVPALGASTDGTTSASALRAVVAADPNAVIPLDGALLDMLIARSSGSALSPEALVYMVERRWAFENRAATWSGDRFFVQGRVQPDSDQAARLGPNFVAFATAHAPALPVKVTIRKPIELRKSQAGLSWYDLMPCFSELPSTGIDPANYARLECERTAIGKGPGGGASGSASGAGSTAGARCAAVDVAAAANAFLADYPPKCGLPPMSLKFADPLKVAIRIPHNPTRPVIQFLGDSKALTATVTLTITDVRLSPDRPAPADILPQTVLDLYDPRPNKPPRDRFPAEYAILSSSFESIGYGDDTSELARVRPEDGISLAGVLRAFEETRSQALAPPAPGSDASANAGSDAGPSADAQPVLPPATPSGTDAPDIIGIHLGMGFAEAEARSGPR